MTVNYFRWEKKTNVGQTHLNVISQKKKTYL